MTSIKTLVFLLCFVGILIGFLLFILFSQTTVKKLRKNTNTKDALGLEVLSGWDILNVAWALGMPRFLSEKLEKSSLSILHAKTSLIYENTTKLDRTLARLIFWTHVSFTSSMFIAFILDDFGFWGV